METERKVAAEWLFTPRRPLPTADMPQRFSVDSLAADKFEWQTALSLALASRLAYEEQLAVENTARNRWGMEACSFFETDDTRCFLAATPKVVLIAFRGTANVGNWLSNLNIYSTTRPYGKVHRGFFGAFQVVDAQLRAELSQRPDRPLLLTGHSLGGALATIAAAEWNGLFPVAWIYTFGQPAVGKGQFVDFMQRFATNFVRFVNNDDIVPRVPPTYRHVGRLFHFDADGELQSRAESLGLGESSGGLPMLSETEFDQLRAALLLQRLNGRAARAELLEAPVVEGLLPSVSDHSLDAYIPKIAALA
jgi:hypothetical protein